MRNEDRLAIGGQLATYANAHADQVGASVAKAQIIAGLALGVAVAAEAAPAVMVCLTNPICRTEASIAVAEMAAGEALGPTSLAVLPATGALVMRKGDQVVGFIDQVGVPI